ncbi:MAG TPA: ABC transporter ATP-binding protein [Tepidisphaeraceae bacterium]|jgi:ATP-binding cassette subfamily B protein|nr:ABC transporter ATP-binding protein [Tepidisphaeraceae bacterium]
MASKGNKARSLWDLTAGQRSRYLAAAVAMSIGIFILYLSPLIVRTAIDGLIGRQPVDSSQRFFIRILESIAHDRVRWAIFLAGLCVITVTFIAGGFTYLKGKWAAIASEEIVRQLRNRLYDRLQHLPISYHDKAQTGDLVQRCTSDVETVRLFYSNQVVEIARCAILVAAVLPILIYLDWRMAIVSMTMLPVVVIFAVLFFKRVQDSFKKADEAEGAMTTVLQENLTGIRVVRAFSRQEFEKEKFEQRNRTHRDLNYRLFWIMAGYWACSDFLCLAQTAIVLIVGGWRVSHGAMSVGTLVAFVTYVSMVIWPVRQMGRILSDLGKALVALGRIEEILNSPEEANPAQVAAENRSRGEIIIKDLSFSHGEKTILQNVNLAIQPGQTIALLGPSGSGKSTLVNLLLRFYDYTSGSITLDGAELKDLDRKYVRSQFGVVMQEPFLYSKTLRDNIKLGRHTAADTQAIEAATMAAIHDSIETFEKKYDTLVGERGVTLSGGQRQRVALARALLKDAPILILDDALSAVDTRTETAILDALKQRRGRQTTIVIAHRLSTLMHADKIVVLDHGRIAQMGTHDQLLSEGGLYRRLWQIQGTLEEDLTREMEIGAALAADDVGQTAAEAAPT